MIPKGTVFYKKSFLTIRFNIINESGNELIEGIYIYLRDDMFPIKDISIMYGNDVLY